MSEKIQRSLLYKNKKLKLSYRKLKTNINQQKLFTNILNIFPIIISIFIVPFFIAITSFNTEVIPLKFMLLFSEIRQNSLLSLFAEVLIINVVFELLYVSTYKKSFQVIHLLEFAGLLILTQSLIASNIISPITLVVTSISFILSLTVQNYYSLKFIITKYLFIFLAGGLGVFGIMLGTFILIVYLSNSNLLLMNYKKGYSYEKQ